MKPVPVDMLEANKRITITVELKNVIVFDFRMSVGLWLIKLGIWVCGINFGGVEVDKK